MSTIIPEGAAMRQAVTWISERLKGDPKARVQKFVNQAITQFNLSPKDSVALMQFYRDAQRNPPQEGAD